MLSMAVRNGRMDLVVSNLAIAGHLEIAFPILHVDLRGVLREFSAPHLPLAPSEFLQILLNPHVFPQLLPRVVPQPFSHLPV